MAKQKMNSDFSLNLHHTVSLVWLLSRLLEQFIWATIIIDC